MKSTNSLAADHVASLANLAAIACAKHAPVPSLSSMLPFLPQKVRTVLLQHLTIERLLQVELCWQTDDPIESDDRDEISLNSNGHDEDDYAAILEQDLQFAWKWHCLQVRNSMALAMHKSTTHSVDKMPNYRRIFWEHDLRLLLREPSAVCSNNTKSVSKSALNATDPPVWRLEGYKRYVESVKLHGRDVGPDNVRLLLQLPHLRRVELHHLEQQATDYPSLIHLLQSLLHLDHIGIYHGSVPGSLLSDIKTAILKRQSSTTSTLTSIQGLEIVSVKLMEQALTQLLELLRSIRTLTSLRISNSLLATTSHTDLIFAAFTLPRLSFLSLEHNGLDDDSFPPVSAFDKVASFPIRHLDMSDNDITSDTLETINSLAQKGAFRLDVLNVANNTEIGLLTPSCLSSILLTPVKGKELTRGLRCINLSNCSLSLPSVKFLFSYINDQETPLEELKLAYNFVGKTIGDLLGSFLKANTTVRVLDVTGIGLIPRINEQDALCDAFEANESLESLSVGENRLRDDGACALFHAIAKRSKRQVYTYANFSGNLITSNGLRRMVQLLQTSSDNSSEPVTSGRKRYRNEWTLDDHQSQSILQFVLVDNYFEKNEAYLGESSDLLDVVRKHVTKLLCNDQRGKNARIVYDDEI